MKYLYNVNIRFGFFLCIFSDAYKKNTAKYSAKMHSPINNQQSFIFLVIKYRKAEKNVKITFFVYTHKHTHIQSCFFFKFKYFFNQRVVNKILLKLTSSSIDAFDCKSFPFLHFILFYFVHQNSLYICICSCSKTVLRM